MAPFRRAAGVARRDEAVNDAARWLSWTKTLRRKSTLVGTVARACDETPVRTRDAADGEGGTPRALGD